ADGRSEVRRVFRTTSCDNSELPRADRQVGFRFVLICGLKDDCHLNLRTLSRIRAWVPRSRLLAGAALCSTPGLPISRSFCDRFTQTDLSMKNREPLYEGQTASRRSVENREVRNPPLRCLFLLNRGRGFSDHI